MDVKAAGWKIYSRSECQRAMCGLLVALTEVRFHFFMDGEGKMRKDRGKLTGQALSFK